MQVFCEVINAVAESTAGTFSGPDRAQQGQMSAMVINGHLGFEPRQAVTTKCPPRARSAPCGLSVFVSNLAGTNRLIPPPRASLRGYPQRDLPWCLARLPNSARSRRRKTMGGYRPGQTKSEPPCRSCDRIRRNWSPGPSTAALAPDRVSTNGSGCSGRWLREVDL
jgi:hypothetical protein